MTDIPTINVAVILLHDNEGRVLLHLRKGEDEMDVPGYWLLPGGTIEVGEAPIDTLMREIKEELGYELQNPRPFTTQDFHIEGKVQGRRHIFIAKCDDTSKVCSQENYELQWRRPDEMEGVKTLDAVPELMQILLACDDYLNKD